MRVNDKHNHDEWGEDNLLFFSDYDEQEEFLLFIMDSRQWIVETTVLEQIFYLEDLTAMPLMPAVILGLTNFGGEVVPVLNPLALLGDAIRTREIRKWRCILMEINHTRFAIPTEDIKRIIRIDSDAKKSDDGKISSFICEIDFEETMQLDLDKLLNLVKSAIRKHLNQAGLIPA